MKILGIQELDERNRIYFPESIFDLFADADCIKIVEEKNQLFIKPNTYNGNAISEININKNSRRATLPKIVRTKLMLNKNNRFVIFIKNNENEIMIKRLDVEKLIGGD